MNTKAQLLESVEQTRVIAIIRAKDSAQLINVVGALRDGGVKLIEVSMTTPNALTVIEEAVKAFDNDVIIGAGTVLDPETARLAITAGAEFVFSPVLKPEMITICRRYSKIAIPGAFTPTEILYAWECGADLVKIFPTSQVGPSYIKAVKAPLPQIDVIAVGGVNLDNARAFIEAGCTAVGVGSSLVKKDFLKDNNFQALSELARQYVEACSG
jgi:2-dehydro-3-deoxyphosphogluconate aldolase / (4S)-4-hydroxy-2-oxoglutarate aldolase